MADILEFTQKSVDALDQRPDAETAGQFCRILRLAWDGYYELVLKNVAAGEHTVAVRVEDEYANQATGKTVIE